MTAAFTYTPMAKAFHWLIVLAVLIMFASALAMDVADEQLRRMVFTTHKTTGFLILLVTFARLYWRRRNPPPAPPFSANHKPLWENIVAVATHHGLYALSVLVPLAGWALVSVGPHGLQLFGIIPVFNLPLTSLAEAGTLRPLLGEAHELLASFFALLIALHIAGALKHHFIDKDGTLLRMSPVCLHKFLKRVRRQAA